jgi:hypothetical protein
VCNRHLIHHRARGWCASPEKNKVKGSVLHCNPQVSVSAGWRPEILGCSPPRMERARTITSSRKRWRNVGAMLCCICGGGSDESIGRLGVKVLKSPPHSPRADAICERVIGTIRREWLDWLIPLTAPHLRSISVIMGSPLQYWAPAHSVGSRCSRSATGNAGQIRLKITPSLCEQVAVCANSVLGGLHHEYFWALSTTPLSICG